MKDQKEEKENTDRIMQKNGKKGLNTGLRNNLYYKTKRPKRNKAKLRRRQT